MSNKSNTGHTRREFLKVIGCSAVMGPALLQAADKTASKPNIIYILADDLGYGDLGCYGQKQIKTPRLDKMAAEGLRFTDHYSGSTVCAPSRCCLMTGVHTGHAYIRGNREVKPEGQYPIPADSITIPKLLKKAGYATGAVGKWGLGFPGSHGAPNKQGFDFWYGYNCQRHAHSYWPTYLWRNEKKEPVVKGTWSHDLLTKEALGFIRRSKDKPFFLYVPYAIPHAQLHVPDVTPYEKEDWPQKEKQFAAMITRLDADVGKILDLLKELKIDDNTLVMFASDNGPHREGGQKPQFFKSAGPFRGIKRDMFEGGIRVPFIANWPGKTPKGKTTAHISAFWDMLPTFCDMAGVKTPKGLDGISILPTILGKNDRQKQHEYLFWVYTGTRTVRKGKWKAIGWPPRFKLYNLEEDIGETTDLYAKYPEVAKDIKRIMIEAFPQPKRT
ncbi:MAG: arylsulfatase [Phycisphaerae bacterium]|nr:arylsulfatase [Phycisphaerae bacterium]